MNNFCLLNNCAAMCYKVLLRQGVSIFVLAFFRSVLILFISGVVVLLNRRGSTSSFKREDSAFPAIPLNLRDSKFLLSQVRSFLGTLAFLLFAINLQLLPITLVTIIF